MPSLLGRLAGLSSSPFSTGLDEDVLFDLLSSTRRRELITQLADRDGPMELGDLAEAIAFIESDESVERVEDVDWRPRKAVYVSIYQSHLPKLADAGVICWDGSDPIEPTATCHNLARILREIRRMNGSDA